MVGPKTAAKGSGTQTKYPKRRIRMPASTAREINSTGMVEGALAPTTTKSNPATATQDQVCWVDLVTLPIAATRAKANPNQGNAVIARTAGTRASSCATVKAGQNANARAARVRTTADSATSPINRQAPAKAIALANKNTMAIDSDGAQKVSAPSKTRTHANGSLGP